MNGKDDIVGAKFALVKEGDLVVHMSRESYDDLMHEVIEELRKQIMIKVKEVTKYMDGGTTKYIDEKGNEYFKDNRLGTKTKGKIFDKYPKEEDAKILDVELEILL